MARLVRDPLAGLPSPAKRPTNVTPLRPRTVIDGDDDTPDTTQATITVDEDGATTLDIPSKKPRKPLRARPKTSDFDRNLAEDIDPMALASLAAWLIEGIEADEQDRSEWEETVNQARKYLGIKLTDPTEEVRADATVCQMVSTAMLEASAKLWATSYAELLPTDGPVKVSRVDTPAPSQPPGGLGMADDAEPGQDPQDQSDASGDDLADALEKDLNWYLTKKDKGYYPDFKKMLMSRNLIGCAFREVYRCPIKKMPISRWVMAQDLIIQGDPAELTEGGRVTARKTVRQSTMKRMMVAGEYLDVALVTPTGQTSPTEMVIGETQGTNPTPTLPRDFEHVVYECYCELGSGSTGDLMGSLDILDLDENEDDPGFPLPYRVSIDKDSRQILAIRRNWEEDDADYKIEPRFVKYGFIPNGVGGYYDLGLMHMVGNPTQAATMLQRSGVDAALFANFPAFIQMQGPGSKPEESVIRMAPGQVKKISSASGAKISDIFMKVPYAPPSAEGMALTQKLEADVHKIAGVIEIPVGEGRIGNTPVGTIMSYIESVTQVPGAVHKDDHIAQGIEYEMLRKLIAKEPEVLWRGNKSPARKWQTREELLSPDIAPAADPNTPSQIHRLLKIQGLIMLGGLPQFGMGDAQGPIVNNREIYKRATEVLVGGDVARYAFPPQPPQAAQPPPPDPRIVAAQIKAQSVTDQGNQKMQEAALDHQGKMAEIAVQSQDKAADREAANQREAMKAGEARAKTGADMVTTAVGHAQDEKAATQQQQHETVQQLTAPATQQAPQGQE